jgi:hypothetical protein
MNKLIRSPSSSKIFIIFLSTSSICFVIRRIFYQVGGFLSSVQWNISNGRKMLLHFLNTTDNCCKMGWLFRQIIHYCKHLQHMIIVI